MKAVILNVKDSGENNRTVTLLSPQTGLFYATLFGGPKSRLRSLVQNFNTGNIWIYDDEVKKKCKITDFEGTSFHLSFSTDIYKIMAASLAAELVIKTKCAGENEKAFVLLTAFLDGLEATSGDEARLGTLRFLWRYLTLMGLERNVSECADCGAGLFTQTEDCAYIEKYGAFVCPECKGYHTGENISCVMDRHGLVYLGAINSLPPGQVRRISLPADSAYKMKQFVYHVIGELLDIRLNTLEAAKGIL